MKKPILKIFKARTKSVNLQAGMSYAELIVVLGIFSVMSAIAIYNYGAFQAKVDIKNLANDIALKVVQAQKDASFGKLPLYGSFGVNKPSYGVHFNRGLDTKSFVYFADLDASKVYTPGTLTCVPGTTYECLEKIGIKKGNYISDISIFYKDSSVISYPNGFYLTFTRPSSELTVAGTGPVLNNVDYAQITVLSPKGISAKIKVYASGRIQIN